MKIKNCITAILMCFILSQSYGQELTIYRGILSDKYYQGKNEISKAEFKSIIKSDQGSLNAWQKSNTYNTIAWLAFGSSVGFSLWHRVDRIKDQSQTLPLVGMIGSFAVAVTFGYSARSLKSKAIIRYNRSIEDSGTLYFGPAPNGVGMVYRF